MPLHDWTDRRGWDGVHHLWISELLRWVKPRLPTGYRAYIGSAPAVAVGAPPEKPDVSVRQWPEEPSAGSAGPTIPSLPSEDPDEEVAVALLDPETSVFVESQGRLVAALELVSPRNKDRSVARAGYLARYVSYLLEGVHLLLVDVHRRPLGFSFADRIAEELQIRQPSCPPPLPTVRPDSLPPRANWVGALSWALRIRLAPTERCSAEPSQSIICRVAMRPLGIASPSNAVRQIPTWPMT